MDPPFALHAPQSGILITRLQMSVGNRLTIERQIHQFLAFQTDTRS